ncbi:DUF2066 domain-containing protein [Simiduia sp. 21SJ11W-1]|uniref:DUF2066 domain-containing protein n=1 Tax=Simiduia sp. 21SJ11W-1 TaxID=2909669 RepID=UPI00209E918A|nr:DUF2066 domain-containing protein [Simiduia sp. 21SJ11W-1]UTA49012.1 DUF2066 domain-containing protein [Simiduia sp. 21SJ11W-1]
MRSLLNAVILLISACWLASPAVAEQLVDLYKVQTLVTSQAAAERERAATEALARLLVRVTGDPKIAENAELQPYMKRAQNYVLQFGYARTEATLTQEDGTQVPATALNFSFSEVAINKLLRKLKLPIWPYNRPGLLVWLVEDQWQGGRTLLRDADTQQALREQALTRGLPLMFPIWDLEDQMAISAEQLWSFDQDALRTASARYQPDVIVVGRYSRTSSGELRGVWEWIDGDDSDLLDAKGDSLQALAAPMVDKIANTLAARYAIQPGQDDGLQLVMQVQGVKAFDRYRKILSYLEQHEALRDVQLVQVEGDSLWLNLYPEADLAHLQRAFQLDRKLSPLPTLVPADGSPTNPLMFEWAGE